MIIPSLLDTDMYEFTVANAFFQLFNRKTITKSKFKCKRSSLTSGGNPQGGVGDYTDEIKREIEDLELLTLTSDEIEYLKLHPGCFADDFISFLKTFKPDPKAYVHIEQKEHDLELYIEGPIVESNLLEVYCLAIINEVYFRHNPPPSYKSGHERFLQNLKLLECGMPFIDFGTRRRRSHAWHDLLIGETVKKNLDNFMGTSNTYFAKKYNIEPRGTMAHKFIQAFQGFFPAFASQAAAWRSWRVVYGDKLSILLTDTFGMDAFFADFTKEMAEQWKGVRQDSYDPYLWGKRLIENYKGLRIDPKSKIITFSNALSFEGAKDLYQTFSPLTIPWSGIGTKYTNDFPGQSPLDIVIKMVECNGQPVAKVNEDSGKTISDSPEWVEYLKYMIKKKVDNATKRFPIVSF